MKKKLSSLNSLPTKISLKIKSKIENFWEKNKTENILLANLCYNNIKEFLQAEKNLDLHKEKKSLRNGKKIKVKIKSLFFVFNNCKSNCF